MFGIIVVLSRLEFSDRRALWTHQQDCKRISSVNLSKDMSRHRFEELLANISFAGVSGLASDDRWYAVSGFMEAINEHRRTYVVPSERICVDESISRWYGLGGDWMSLGLPHYVALERNPENGSEIKAACCGQSGIMLSMELSKSSEETGNFQHEAAMQHGPATILRLVEPWLNSNRIVCADSYFSFVETAEQLLKRGMRFTGVVKTASRGYPIGHLSSMELTSRGQHAAMLSKTRDGNKNLMAVMWLYRDRRYFISSTGITTQGNPILRSRWRMFDNTAKRVDFLTPIPSVCEKYYDTCSKIDRHNRCRQDDLNLEKKFQVKSWSQRVNTSLLAVIMVDAWMLYKGSRGTRDTMTLWRFYCQLADELIDNTHDDFALRSRRCEDNVTDNTPENPLMAGIGPHLVPTTKRRKKLDGTYTNAVFQGHCRICKNNRKSKYLCSACKISAGIDLHFCHPDTGRGCFSQHLILLHGISLQ